MRFVQNGLIILYQDIHYNSKRDPTYDITSDRRKSLIDFNIFWEKILTTLIVSKWYFIIIFIISFHIIFNKTILNFLVSLTFGKVILTFFLINFFECYFILPYSLLWDIFIFYSSEIPYSFSVTIYSYTNLRYWFFCKNSPNFINCCISILQSYRFLLNFIYYFLTLSYYFW